MRFFQRPPRTGCRSSRSASQSWDPPLQVLIFPGAGWISAHKTQTFTISSVLLGKLCCWKVSLKLDMGQRQFWAVAFSHFINRSFMCLFKHNYSHLYSLLFTSYFFLFLYISAVLVYFVLRSFLLVVRSLVLSEKFLLYPGELTQHTKLLQTVIIHTLGSQLCSCFQHTSTFTSLTFKFFLGIQFLQLQWLYLILLSIKMPIFKASYQSMNILEWILGCECEPV